MQLRETPLPKSATIAGNNAKSVVRKTLPYLETNMQTVALVVAGEGEWWFDGQWHVLKPGWMNWRYPEERKRIRSSAGYRTIVFRFQMQRHGKLRLPRFCAWRDPHEASIWAEAECERFTGQPVDAMQARIWYDRLLAEVQWWQEQALHGDQPDLLRSALQLLEDQTCDSSIDMHILADQLSCSERSLYAVFKQHHDCSPQQHLQRLRIARARELLAHSDASIQDIAESVGYVVPASFSRAFKQETASTPSQWRRLHGM